MLHLVSTIVLVLVAVGLSQRRQPRVHRGFMLAAAMTDIGLLLYIEATRHAVDTVVHRATPLLWFHVAVSVGVLACYAWMIGLGRRLVVGDGSVRIWHRNVGISFCVLRLLNYVTSYMV